MKKKYLFRFRPFHLTLMANRDVSTTGTCQFCKGFSETNSHYHLPMSMAKNMLSISRDFRIFKNPGKMTVSKSRINRIIKSL